MPQRNTERGTRQAVLARDGCRCTFTNEHGVRCTTTLALQVDHIQPLSRGGSNEPENLRSLCVRHHRARGHSTVEVLG